MAKNPTDNRPPFEIKPGHYFFWGILIIQLGIVWIVFSLGGNITYHLGFEDVILVGWWQLKDSLEFSSQKTLGKIPGSIFESNSGDINVGIHTISATYPGWIQGSER